MWLAAPIPCPDGEKISKSVRTFPALAGKPSAFMSSLLEFRSPLLITQLGTSFEMLCVILDNSQNDGFKVEQMLRRGMLVVVYSVRLKDFG